MNNFDNPFDDVAEALLADVAISIQLPPGKHKKAVERSEALQRHMERDGSALKDLIALFYPQGSMSIGATINNRLKNDEFDIDKVAELFLPEDTPPAQVLDLLYWTIKGEKGSRYYDMTERKTRCVTVHYADDMHLDITPMILVKENLEPRTSWLFHAHEDEPESKHERLVGNPKGFGDHFNETVAQSSSFAEAYGRRAMEREFLLEYKAEAENEPVPDPEPAYLKPVTVVALQLLKRHRNVIYDDRKGRMPPSIMLSALVLDVSGQSTSLSEEMLIQARHIRDRLKEAHSRNRLIEVVNPRCVEDKFTDRWPENLSDQAQFMNDLKNYIQKIEVLQYGQLELSQIQYILKELFGESPAKSAVDYYTENLSRLKKGNDIYSEGTGRISLVAPALIGISTPAIAKPNTFYGGVLKE